MSAALSRYANAGQPIGHAGPDAPIHADERIALADLPRLAEAVDAADAPRLRRELREVAERLERLQAAGYRAADDMDKAAALLSGHYLAKGYADFLREHADELRAAIARSEA